MATMPPDPITQFEEAVILAAHAIQTHPGGGKVFLLELERRLAEADSMPDGEAFDLLLRDLMSALIASTNLASRDEGIKPDDYLADTTAFVRSTLRDYRTRRIQALADQHSEVRPPRHPHGK